MSSCDKKFEKLNARKRLEKTEFFVNFKLLVYPKNGDAIIISLNSRNEDLVAKIGFVTAESGPREGCFMITPQRSCSRSDLRNVRTLRKPE